MTKTGLVHACAFLLLRLSSLRDFGASLNAPYAYASLPLIDLTVPGGSMADLLILIVHKFIVTCPEVCSIFFVVEMRIRL